MAVRDRVWNTAPTGRRLDSSRLWSAVAHPWLPSYLAIIGAATFGVTDDRPPGEAATAPSLGSAFGL